METADVKAKPEKKVAVVEKVVKRVIVFQGQEYDLNNLTQEEKAYLAQFPNEVPFL
jgi:hypothetical protein